MFVKNITFHGPYQTILIYRWHHNLYRSAYLGVTLCRGYASAGPVQRVYVRFTIADGTTT